MKAQMALDGVGWSTPGPGRFAPRNDRTHCTGGWVGPRAGLDGCWKSRLTCPIGYIITVWRYRVSNSVHNSMGRETLGGRHCTRKYQMALVSPCLPYYCKKLKINRKYKGRQLLMVFSYSIGIGGKADRSPHLVPNLRMRKARVLLQYAFIACTGTTLRRATWS
jgi:hypothetical protein